MSTQTIIPRLEPWTSHLGYALLGTIVPANNNDQENEPFIMHSEERLWKHVWRHARHLILPWYL